MILVFLKEIQTALFGGIGGDILNRYWENLWEYFNSYPWAPPSKFRSTSPPKATNSLPPPSLSRILSKAKWGNWF